jgi:hypothetical protein
MPRVFLSHSTQDRQFVESELLPTLHQHGIDTWYAQADIHTTEEWERMIVRGLQLCDWFLVVLSENAAASKWVRAEVHWAIDKREGRLIPLFLRTCDPDNIHLRLRTIQYVDFRTDPSSGRDALLRIWGKHTPKPLPARGNTRSAEPTPTPPFGQGAESTEFTLLEELVLLSRDDRTGARLANDTFNPQKRFLGGYTINCFSYALHGAALAELLLRGHIVLRNGGVQVLSNGTTGDIVLDGYLRTCSLGKSDIFPSDDDRSGTVREADVLAQLVERGVMKQETTKRLWLFTDSIHKPQPAPKLRLVQRLVRAFAASSDAMPRRIKILLALLHESDNWAMVATYAGGVSTRAQLDSLIGTDDEVVTLIRTAVSGALDRTVSEVDAYNAGNFGG